MKGHGSFLIGWEMGDITPVKQVALMGQFYDRFSESVRDPITVTALAMESIDGKGNSLAQIIMVSCDTGSIADHIQIAVKEEISKRLENFDHRNIFLAFIAVPMSVKQLFSRKPIGMSAKLLLSVKYEGQVEELDEHGKWNKGNNIIDGILTIHGFSPWSVRVFKAKRYESTYNQDHATLLTNPS